MMTRTLFLFACVFCIPVLGWTQGAAINTTGSPAHPSAMLDVNSETSGVLIPRMTTAQRNSIASPSVGLQIFNTTTNCLNYFDGQNWLVLCGQCPLPAGTNAGPDQLVEVGSQTFLAANTPDDGEGLWTVQSGIGGAFVDASSPVTQFNGVTGSAYILRWTVTNGCGVNFDEVIVVFGFPEYISGRRIWLKADAGVVESSGAVSQWTDQSGNNHHATQSTSNRKPQFISNALNGLPVIRFDGNLDVLFISGSQTVGSAFVVFNWGGGTGGAENYEGIISQQTSGGVADGIIFTGQGTDLSTGLFGTNIYVDGVQTNSIAPVNEYKVLAGVATSPGSFSNLQIGADRQYGDLYGRWWNGDMAEIIIYDVPLSAADRFAVESYLKLKWGIN